MNTTTQPGPLEVRLSDQLGPAPERTYTRTQLLAAIEAERHACSIAVWMTLHDALADDADDKGLEGWLREAEQRVKNRSANDPDVSALTHAQIQATCRKALRPVECSHTGMSYGDDKAGGPSAYTRGWGDCLKAVKAALGLVA